MSDPVTNIESDDVLASIRRLVTEGDRARKPVNKPVEAAHESPIDAPKPAAGPSRFVLTPALRVASTDGIDSEEQSSEALRSAVQDIVGPRRVRPVNNSDGEHKPTETAVAADTDSDDHLRDLRASMSRFAGFDPYSLVSKETAPADPPDFVADAVDEAPIRAEPEPAQAAETAADDHPEEASDEVTFASGRHSLEEKIAALEAAVSGQADEWEPDGSEMEPAEMEWTPINNGSPRARGREDTDAEDAEILEETTHSGEAVAQKAVEAEVGAAVEDNIDVYLEEVGEIDEETLRRLVAEVVREELSGELGERITRNIRKLVRREISQALSVQEFD